MNEGFTSVCNFGTSSDYLGLGRKSFEISFVISI